MKRSITLLLAIALFTALLAAGFTVRASAAGATPDDYTYEEWLAMTDAEKEEFMALFPTIPAYVQWVNAARKAYEAENPIPEIGEDGVVDLSSAASVDGTEYYKIDNAIAAAQGKTLVLLKNAGDISVSGNITIDLNGKTLGTVTLTSASATVSSASDLTVTTSVSDSHVVQNGTTWSVAAKVYLASVNGEGFENLNAAVAAAESGDTITLLDNVEIDTLLIPTGVSLDLAGKILTVTTLDADTAQVTDSEQSGLIQTESAAFNPANSELPLYDTAAGGYRIAKVTVKTLVPQWSTDGVVYTFRFDLTNAAWEQLLLNAAVEIGIRIEWDSGSENFAMTEEQVSKVISDPTGGFGVTVTGMTDMPDASISTFLKSAATTVIGGRCSK